MCGEIKVSVIIPVYNGEKFIFDCIQSVLKQTYKNIEIVIVDDYSSDNTENIIKEIMAENGNILYFRNEENKGVAFSRNFAISKSSGRFVCFLDSDDLMLPEKVEKQVAFMLENKVAFSYTNYQRISEDCKILKSDMRLMDKCNRKQVITKMPMLVSTVMLDTETVSREKIAFPLIATSEDRALFSFILRELDYAYLLNDILSNYRVRNNSLSSNKFKNLKNTWKYYRKIEKFGFFKSACYMISYISSALNKRK